MNEFLLMSDEQRERLKQVQLIIDSVLKELDYEYDDQVPLKTASYYLNQAIYYENKHC